MSDRDDYSAWIYDFYQNHPAMDDKDFDFISLVMGHMTDDQLGELHLDLMRVHNYRQENGID